MERENAVTLKGDPFTLVGPELKVGDSAPEFETIGKDLQPVTLADIKGTPELEGMWLVRQSRLSVSPVTAKEWRLILKMSETKL